MTEISEKELIENLMRPRYKVITDYPGSNMPKGYVIDDVSYYRRRGVDFDLYPAIFKRLEWHEERQESEMPKYVKFIKPYHKAKKGDVEKVNHYDNSLRSFWTDTGGYNLSETDMLPATSEEYLSFINQNKQS